LNGTTAGIVFEKSVKKLDHRKSVSSDLWGPAD
jgi:hypothetical protein